MMQRHMLPSPLLYREHANARILSLRKAFAYYQQHTAGIAKRIWRSSILHCIWRGCMSLSSYGSAHFHQIGANIFIYIWNLVLFVAVQYVMQRWWSHWQFWLAAYFEALSQNPLTSEGNSDRWCSHYCSSYQAASHEEQHDGDCC